eukprot:4354514-Alexandrium_andersonii.AAC.1
MCIRDRCSHSGLPLPPDPAPQKGKNSSSTWRRRHFWGGARGDGSPPWRGNARNCSTPLETA